MEGYEMDNVTYYKELYRYFLDIKNNVKCNQCKMFPCVTIKNMLSRTEMYKEICQKVCTTEEYNLISEAFFNKYENLCKKDVQN
jgi:hypothetical protein